MSAVHGHCDYIAVAPLPSPGRQAEEFARHSVEHGTPAEMAAAVQNLNELFRAGRAGVLADDITNLTGLAPRTFREWAERHVGVFE